MMERTDETVRLTNGTVDLEVSVAIGLRVLRYGRAGTLRPA